MSSEVEGKEETLKSLLMQLHVECGVFERIIYKNKNQHRRAIYFQYLLKVRRDLRLLQSAKLEDLIGYCFHVIIGKKPKQKMHLLESLKRRKCVDGTPNFLERLLGAARLLSMMVEPMLKAATEVSILLARSFFMGFCLTILALLARLRVLVQQILLEVVSVFNTVSSISQKKQSVKINQEGLEVFREYFPTNGEFITIECVWKKDKFVLIERVNKSADKDQENRLGDAFDGLKPMKYHSVESFLGDDDYDDMRDSLGEQSNGKQVEGGNSEDKLDQKLLIEREVHAATSSSPSTKPMAEKSSPMQPAVVCIKRPLPAAPAFVSVKRPSNSPTKGICDHGKGREQDFGNKKDSFFNLLTDGIEKDNLL